MLAGFSEEYTYWLIFFEHEYIRNTDRRGLLEYKGVRIKCADVMEVNVHPILLINLLNYMLIKFKYIPSYNICNLNLLWCS